MYSVFISSIFAFGLNPQLFCLYFLSCAFCLEPHCGQRKVRLVYGAKVPFGEQITKHMEK